MSVLYVNISYTNYKTLLILSNINSYFLIKYTNIPSVKHLSSTSNTENICPTLAVADGLKH